MTVTIIVNLECTTALKNGVYDQSVKSSFSITEDNDSDTVLIEDTKECTALQISIISNTILLPPAKLKPALQIMFSSIVFLTCLFICSINAFSPTIFLSDHVPLEFELPQMTSDRIVSTVIANVDGNDDPDAIIFYVISTSSTQTRIKWHVVYDITLGVRMWEGNNGFYPMRNVDSIYV
ncbi:hypothetical protein GEMRC1_013887 [Eukaryota sp. GEM-RC1]